MFQALGFYGLTETILAPSPVEVRKKRGGRLRASRQALPGGHLISWIVKLVGSSHAERTEGRLPCTG